MPPTKEDHNALVVPRGGDMRSIHEKSISNTKKEVRNPPSSPSIGLDVSVDCARNGRYPELEVPPRPTFGGAATAMLQMSAA